jgi:hypothetical protein
VPLLIEQYGWSDALRLAFEPHARIVSLRVV